MVRTSLNEIIRNKYENLLNCEKVVVIDGITFDGYTVTPDGIIYSLNYGGVIGNKKPIKQLINKENNIPDNKCYRCVNLYKDHKLYRKYVHRIVAYAFIPIPKELLDKGYTYDTLEVNHINPYDKSKNSVYDLEWVTPKENTHDAIHTGCRTVKYGDNSPNHIISENMVHDICKLLESNLYTVTEIANMLHIKPYYIINIKRGLAFKDISRLYNISNHTKGTYNKRK